MAVTDTELRLRDWRDGSAQAERLAAAVLHLAGYQNVEPQAPLGGPDDRADILCERGGRLWMAATYFPPLPKRFADIKAKFLHDLEGVKRHRRQGIVFFTNQRISLKGRKELVGIALKKRRECELWDVERIKGRLDVPEGYGVRIAMLRIPLSLEEQLAFFAQRDNRVESAVERNTAELRRLGVQVAGLQVQQRHVAHTMESVAALAGVSSVLPPPRVVDPLALGDLTAQPGLEPLSANLSPSLVLMVHRIVGFELPPRIVGRFRSASVHLGGIAGPPPELSPVAPSDVPRLLDGLCLRWREQWATIAKSKRLVELARFHHEFLAIHPFLDGNGRVARAILLQQCLDLFGRADMSRFDRGAPYNVALRAADADGNLDLLVDLIKPVVSG